MKAHILALGVISFGLPWNRISFGFNLACSSIAATMLLAPLLSNSSSPIEQICHPWPRPRLNRSSQASISCQAPSLRKLCTATMDSTASSGVSSNPLRSIALYICCGEGYSQLESESPRGIEDMVRSSGRCVLCSVARDCESSKGIQFRGFSLEEVRDGWLELLKRVFRSLLVHDPGSEEGTCEGLEEVALCMGQLGFRYIS